MKRLSLTAFAAGALLTASAQINSPAAPGYYERGNAFFNQQSALGTVQQLKQAAASRQLSNDEMCRLDLLVALATLQQGQYEKAEALLDRWLDTYGASEHRTLALMAKGDTYFGRRNYAAALAIYNDVDARALANTDDACLLAYRQGYCCLQVALFDEADAAFAKLEKSAQWSNAARFYRGYIAYAQGDMARAKQIFGTVDTSKAPGNMTDFYLSQIYYKEGDYGRALSAARQQLSQQTAVPPVFTAEANRVAGESLFRTGQPAEAVPYLKKYVAYAGNDAMLSALYILGQCEYADGMYEAAANTLRRVAQDDSAMGQNALVYMGQALLKNGDANGAVMAFDRALQMTHDDAARENAFYNYAVAKYAGGAVPFGNAVGTFEEFLQRYPSSRYANDVRKYVITGYMLDDNYDAALAAIERVQRPGSDVLNAKQQVLYTMGTRALKGGKLATALERLEDSYAMGQVNEGAYTETLLALGEALLLNGQNERAAQLLGQYLAKGTTENTPVAMYDLGYAQMGLRKYGEAENTFQRLTAQPGTLPKPIVADIWTRLGDARYYQRKWNDAATAYSKSYELNPSAADYALFQQAAMQGYAGNFTEKLATLQRLQREFGTSSLLPDAMLEMTEAQLQTGKRADALSTLQYLIKTWPETTQARSGYLQMASTQIDAGKRAEALDTYRALIKRYPTSTEAARAADLMRRMAAADGTLQQFEQFMASVENAPKVDASETDRIAFETAEQHYVDGQGLKLMEQYVAQYGDKGTYSLQALSYLMEAAQEAGNTDRAYEYASRIASRWPDNSASELAYAIKGATEYARGNGEAALQSWQQLERRASTPAMANEARMGIMRVARDLGRADDLLAAANAVLSSSTVGAEDKTEATFSRGLAQKLNGNTKDAVATWRTLFADFDALYGAKAAVYTAETLLEENDAEGARQTAQKLVSAGTPHSYWLARAFITLSDALRAKGNKLEANEYLRALRNNYPGTEPDIFNAIDTRLNN